MGKGDQIDEFVVVMDAFEPKEAKARFNEWLKAHPEVKTNLQPEDIMIDHLLVESDGKKTCLDRYRVRKSKL